MIIVIEHRQGPLAGMMQIAGFVDGDIPPHIQGPFQVGDYGREIEFASLIKVTPRYVLYREVEPRPTGRFGEYMNSWHPDQR